MEHQTRDEVQCPVCGTTVGEPSLRCKDYSVSGEMFDICVCKECMFGMTHPQPSPSETGRYYQTSDYISHSDTARGIINKLYHVVRKKNTGNKLATVGRYSAHGEDLLDVGCGTGYFLSACKKNGRHIEGVEVNETARAAAEARSGQPIYPSTDELEASGKQFDVITLWHVFEHLHDINASFAQLKRLLKPSGLIIMALPNPACADAAYYRECWAAYDVPRHLSHFSPRSIKLLSEKHQMQSEAVIPMKFDAYYISMLSEGLKGRGKAGALLHGFIQGCRSNRTAAKTGNYSSLIYVLRKL